MAPYQTSEKFVMAPYFHQIFLLKIVLGPVYSYEKRLKKCLVPYQFKPRQLTFPSLVRLPLVFSPGCVGAMVCVKTY